MDLDLLYQKASEGKAQKREYFNILRQAYGVGDDELQPNVYESMVCQTTRNNLVLTWKAGSNEHEDAIFDITAKRADDGTYSMRGIKEALLNLRDQVIQHSEDPLCYALSYRRVEGNDIMGVMTILQMDELFQALRYLANGKIVSVWIDCLADTSDTVSNGRWSSVGLKPYAEMPVICLADIGILQAMSGRGERDYRDAAAEVAGIEQSLWIKMECQIGMLYKGLYKNSHVLGKTSGVEAISETSRHSMEYSFSEHFIRKDTLQREVVLEDLEEIVVLHIASSKVAHKVTWLDNVSAVVQDFSSARGLTLNLKAAEERIGEDGFCRYHVALEVGPREYSILLRECFRRKIMSRTSRDDFESFAQEADDSNEEESFRMYKALLPGVVCGEDVEQDSQGLRMGRDGDVMQLKARKLVMERYLTVFMLWKLEMVSRIDGEETVGPYINFWIKAAKRSDGSLRYVGGGVVHMAEESWARIEESASKGRAMKSFVRENAGEWLDVLDTSCLLEEEDFGTDVVAEGSEWEIS